MLSRSRDALCLAPSRSPDAPRKPETGYAAVGIPRGDAGATGRAPYASKGAGLAIPAHALLAVLNGLWLLALGPLLGDLAIALDTSLAKAFGTLFEAPGWGRGGLRRHFAIFGAVCAEGIDRECIRDDRKDTRAGQL